MLFTVIYQNGQLIYRFKESKTGSRVISSWPRYLRWFKQVNKRARLWNLFVPHHMNSEWPLSHMGPSPPPWGWSTGFIATPLTMGRLPNHRLCPAFLSLRAPCNGLETCLSLFTHPPQSPAEVWACLALGSASPSGTSPGGRATKVPCFPMRLGSKGWVC